MVNTKNSTQHVDKCPIRVCCASGGLLQHQVPAHSWGRTALENVVLALEKWDMKEKRRDILRDRKDNN